MISVLISSIRIRVTKISKFSKLETYHGRITKVNANTFEYLCYSSMRGKSFPKILAFMEGKEIPFILHFNEGAVRNILLNKPVFVVK